MSSPDTSENDLDDPAPPAAAGHPSTAAIDAERLRLAFQSLDVWNHRTRRPYTFDEAIAIAPLAIAIRIRAREMARRLSTNQQGEEP